MATDDVTAAAALCTGAPRCNGPCMRIATRFDDNMYGPLCDGHADKYKVNAPELPYAKAVRMLERLIGVR